MYLAASDSSGTDVNVIADFLSGTDTIDLNGVLGGTGSYLGEANGLVAANTALTGAAGEVVLDTSTNQLYVDVTGTGSIDSTDVVIELTGVTDLAATDFVF